MARERVSKQSTELVDQVLGQIDEMAATAKSMGDRPSFEFVEQSPRWREMGDNDRLRVMDYARAKGLSDWTAARLQGTQDKRLAWKRRFLGYDISLDTDGALRCSERVIERNKDGSEEEKVRVARFPFPVDFMERLGIDAVFRKLCALRLTELRLEVDDGKGVKLFIDRPKDSPGKFVPKWKYCIEGKTREDVFAAEEMPNEVVAVVRGGDDYWKDATYRSWFGRSMQRKREEVLVEAVLAELEDDAAAAARDKSETAEMLRAAYIAGVGRVGKAELRRGVKEVLIDFAELINDSESAERYSGVLEDFVWTGIVAKARVTGHEEPGVSRQEVREAVSETIAAYLEGSRRVRVDEEPKRHRGRARLGGGLIGRVKSLGGRVTKSTKGERRVVGAVIPLPSLNVGNRQSADLFREVIEDELMGQYDAATIARTVVQIKEYVQGRNPVAKRFRSQVAGVERGKLVIRDYDLMVAAARKFAKELKKKH